MGQYLAIGLVTEFGTSIKNLKNVTKDELITEMENKLHFCPEIYDFSETSDHYLFNLKSQVLENQLVPFLKKIYPMIYRGSDNNLKFHRYTSSHHAH